MFDLNVAPSVTSTGRSLISSAILCFEGFLGNNVKFSSLNDVLIFIDHVRMDAPEWKYNDFDILGLDGFADVDEVFNKLILNCGYKYIPSIEDMDTVYSILQNCNQFELNRLFYKNNLYSFMDLPIARDLMIKMITNMDIPYVEPMNPPQKIIPYLDELKGYLLEYVFYNHMYMDRMDRNKNMIKTISLVSDTDSSFVSLDAWVRYNIEYLKNFDSPILHQRIDIFKAIEKNKKSDWGDEEIPEWYNAYNKDFAVNGTNVNFIQVTGDNSLKIRTYERGVEGETLACGTGCAASAIIAIKKGLVKGPVRLLTSGGKTLTVYYDNDTVYLQGEGRRVYIAKLQEEAYNY